MRGPAPCTAEDATQRDSGERVCGSFLWLVVCVIVGPLVRSLSPLGQATRTGMLAALLVAMALYWLYAGLGYRPLLLVQARHFLLGRGSAQPSRRGSWHRGIHSFDILRAAARDPFLSSAGMRRRQPEHDAHRLVAASHPICSPTMSGPQRRRPTLSFISVNPCCLALVITRPAGRPSSTGECYGGGAHTKGGDNYAGETDRKKSPAGPPALQARSPDRGPCEEVWSRSIHHVAGGSASYLPARFASRRRARRRPVETKPAVTRDMPPGIRIRVAAG